MGGEGEKNIAAQLSNNWFQQIHRQYFRHNQKKQKRSTLATRTVPLQETCLTVLYHSQCDAHCICCVTHIGTILTMFTTHYATYLLVKERCNL